MKSTTIIHARHLPGRNEKFPCGSGRKAKRCCLPTMEALEAMPPAKREAATLEVALGHTIQAVRT